MTSPTPDFFSDPGVIADSRSYFELMRARGPVTPEAFQNTLMVTGFDAALEVLNDKTGVFSNACSVVGPIPGLPFAPEGSDIRDQLERHRGELPWADHLVCMDGKRHQEHRMLLGGLLTYKRLKQNEDYLRGLADRLIDGFIGKARCEVMPEYAHATTTYAISDLMGIPEDDRAELLELIGAPPSQIDGDAVHKIGPDPLISMKPRFDEYLRDRLERPRGDLMSDLVHATFKDGLRPEFDAVSALARFLFGAGQDTTSRLIAMAVLILAEDPVLQQRLRDEPRRISDFVEEVLRYDAPVKVAYRLALADTEVAGVAVTAGTILTVCYNAASNDSAHFEHPERFDIDRPNLRDHMGFGRGFHGCLGAPLGRMEARIAIERLLARANNIRISDEHHGPAENRHYRFEPTYTFRSLAELHIEFEPA
ncbi:cytochrome P450 [Novosphingobium endophyticum]|uniref:Cytochrome P450 n=1 Tax=Novosphingobium endophyticum TaxID=1955250 RepID=A0A916TVP8_9SPHN|nr:cytochrome P450 [Novosphingobium endophyticum]GGC16330.1 cytochrome P450 [Novosphingobium endophyticum]